MLRWCLQDAAALVALSLFTATLLHWASIAERLSSLSLMGVVQ